MSAPPGRPLRRIALGAILLLLLGGATALLLASARQKGPEPGSAPVPPDDVSLAGGKLQSAPRSPGLGIGGEASDSTRVIVRTRDGGPIPGALITAVPRDALFVEPAMEAVRQETNGSGEATLGALPDGAVWLFAKAGFVPRTMVAQELAASRAGGTAQVVLEPGRALEGMVVDPWGQPISGAIVEARGGFGEALSILGPESAGPRAAVDLCSGVTGEGGRFRIDGIAEFPVEVVAHLPDFGAVGVGGGKRPRSESGEFVRVVLSPLLRVGLDVRDAATQESIPTADVVPTDIGDFDPADYGRTSRRSDTPRSGWSADHALNWSTWSAGETLRLLLEGKMPRHPEESSAVTFAIEAVGYRPVKILAVPRAPDANGAVATTPVRLLRLDSTPEDGWLTLQFLCAPASPPPSVRLKGTFVALGVQVAKEVSFSAQTDEAGFARLRLPAGRYRLAIEGLGSLWWRSQRVEPDEIEVPPKGSAALAIRIACARLRGRVRDVRGARLAAFLLSMAEAKLERRSHGAMGWVSGDAFIGNEVWAGTRSDRTPGSFDFLLSPGTYGFHVSHHGFQIHSEVVTLAEGEDRVIEIVLEER